MAHDPSASVDVLADPDLDNRHAVSFPVVRRGYDQVQVDHVLGDMTSQIDALQRSTAELREREADLQAALDAAEYRARAAEAMAHDLAATADAAAASASASLVTPSEPEPQAAPLEQVPVGGEPAVPTPTTATSATADAGDVAAMVGEETARIVEAARHAAVEIGVRAREDAERIVGDARDEARSIRADAEVQLLHRTREADDAVAARLLEAADAVQEATARAEAIVADGFTEAATVVLRAREEAEAIVAAGEQAARELTDAAEAARDDLLVDLVRRRKVLRRQVEQLEAGRVRLRAAYAIVEGALTDATDELDRTVAEARDAAIAAAERADAADDPEVRAVAAALGADPDAVLDRADPDRATPMTDPAADAEPAEPEAADAEHAEAESAEVANPTGAEPTGVHPNEEPIATSAASEPDPPPAAVEPSAVEVAEIDLRSEEQAPSDPSLGRDATVAVADAGSPTSAEAPARSTSPAPADASSRRRRRAPDPVEFEGRWSSAVRVLPPGPETTDSDPSGGGSSSGRDLSASEVFARLRAGSNHQPSLFDPAGLPEGPPASDADDVAVAVVANRAEDAAAATSGADDGHVDPEEAWLVRRDAAFAPALRALRRRLKATLADDEDSLLESVRRTVPLPETIDSIRDALARRDDLAVALVASLATAAAAGGELAAGPGTSPVADHDAVAVDQIAVDLADVVVGPLDERLERCVARYHKAIADAGAPADDAGAAREAALASLESSIKAAYRARRGAQVQVPTEHAVLVAGHRGLVAALEPGTPLRWVVASPSPVGRRSGAADGSSEAADPTAGARVCASCVAVADVGAGDPFGHGPLLPPARPGCRCAVAPVTAVVPRRP